MTYLEEYWSLIERREVVVGYWIREAMRNLISELDDSAYIYDTGEAHKRIRFMETMCLQSMLGQELTRSVPGRLDWFMAFLLYFSMPSRRVISVS